MDIEIGRGKRARRAYTFDDIAVVPSRRTRNPEDVSTAWTIDAFSFDIPVLGAPMDSVVSPRTAIMLGQLGGLGVLDLEGLWTRYDDPQPLLDEIASLPAERATTRMQQLYSEPIKPELIKQRLAEIREAGVTVAGSLTPQRTQELYETVVAAGVDLFVIRGTTVSAEHVSSVAEPLNLKKFIYDLDVPVIVGGAATYTAALHLMRTGAAGVLVGFGGGAASTTRATLGQWLRQRVAYGASAAALAERHGDAAAPLRTSGWSALMWGLAIGGLPVLGAGVGAATTVALTPKLHGLEHPAREAWRIAGKGNLWAATSVADAVRRPWWPLALLLALVNKRSRLPVLAAFALPIVVAKPRRFGLLRLLDDMAYGVGVWLGCRRARSIRALLPAFTGPVGRPYPGVSRLARHE